MSGTLSDVLSDPGVNALLGAAQGFAQAAMPTRMPTPWGAVLGAGAGGLEQGLKTSQQLQQGAAQTQAAQMQNQLTKSSMPAAIARNNYMNNLWSNQALLQQGFGQTAGSVTGGGGSVGSVPGGAPGSSGGPMDASTYASKVNSGENNTGNPAALNQSGPNGTPTSSAMGNGQFLEGTWLPLFKQTYPDKAAGMSDSDILALRGDPGTSAAMTAAYGQQNAGILQDAGVPATAANLALAHRFGPQGAISLTKADPTANVGDVLGAGVVSANPDLKGKTASQVIAPMTMKFGAAPVNFGTGVTTAASGATTGINPGVQVAGPGAASPSGSLVDPTTQQPITPAQALQQYQIYENRAKQAQGAKNLQAMGGPPTSTEDPAVLHATAQQYLKMALVGPTTTAEEQAKAPFQLNRVNAGGVIFDGNGNVKGFAPVQSNEVVLSGPMKGTHVTVLRNPIDDTIIGAPPPGPTAPFGAAPSQPTMPGSSGSPAAPVSPQAETGGLPAGSIPTALPPQTIGRLEAQGGIEGDDIKHDRKTVEEDLTHVIDNAQPAQQQLLLLRGLAPEAYTGFGGQFRADVKNFFQTFMPDAAKDLAPDAAPAQEFAKVALMQAGKQERGDLGARGGSTALQMYANANPNLNMQEVANGHMANALLISQQRGVDYATGATSHYLKNRSGFMDQNNPQPYTPLSAYDNKFINTMKPELYYSAIQAINGKPQNEWANGLKPGQASIVAGIVQRADPNASINIGGKMVPISAVKNVVSPSDILASQNGQ